MTRIKILLPILLLAFFSCKKGTDETPKSETETTSPEMVSVESDNFEESDEDLLTVDYKQSYDELAPHGDWVQVSAEDIGVNLKLTSANGSRSQTPFGNAVLDAFIPDARAESDADIGAFFVWRPSPNLAVTLAAGDPVGYMPYTNGQWVYTDAGWYFQAPTPYEEITVHYGRWVSTPTMGWVWLPGRVWAPAWVSWRETDTYVAWTPIPPSVYIVNNILTPPIIDDPYRYVIVEKRYFLEPSVYKYKYSYHENKNKIMIKEMTISNGLVVQNKTIINKGPEVSVIQKVTGKNVEMVKLKRVSSPKDVKYTFTEFAVYSPKFTKVKSQGKHRNMAVSSPSSFKKMNEVKVTGEMKEENAKQPEVKEKGLEKKEQKEIKKEEKGKLKEEKGKHKEEKDNKEKEKGKDMNKGQDKGKDKGPKNKGKK